MTAVPALDPAPFRLAPPYRADHVGSFLRPAYLLAARDAFAAGRLDADELRGVEDRAIAEIVKYQENAGLRVVTDGEFRRKYFHVDFLVQLEGVAEKGGLPVRFHNASGELDYAPPVLHVNGRVMRRAPIEKRNFEFLRSVATQTVKITIPSPTMLHFRGGRAGIDQQTYPDLEAFYADVARAYREEIHDLAAAGCTYLQLDDTNLAYLCDGAQRERTRQRGDDPDALPRLYARLINDAIASRPETMTVGIHLCRGNFRSSWAAEGGYEPVAEVLFRELDVDTYFLEYDDARSGDFRPLRFLPPNKTVVLGLVSTKLNELETRDAIRRRIDAAAQYVPLEQLCLSPQCGFASTVHGNDMAVAMQTQKLKLVTDVARDVWGTV